MNVRLVVYSSLFVLAACSSSGGTGTGSGGTPTSGGGAPIQTGGTGNPSGGNANGMNTGGTMASTGGTANNAGNNTGGTMSNTGGSGGTANNAGSNTGGTMNNTGGSGGAMTNTGGSGGVPAGGGGTGGMAVIPSTCGMPVVNMTPGNTCPGAAPPALKTTQIIMANQISNPLFLTSPPGDTHRLFVNTRRGLIHIIKDGALLPTPFLDLTDTVASSGGESEPGLLGVAFDPAYDTTGKFWLFYSIDGNPIDSVLAMGNVSAADPDVADKASLQTLFTVHKPADNHNGGMINFGTDGCLYVSYGDGGNQDDPSGNGQNTSEPLGSILRVDPVTGMAAPGNPGYMDARIWIYGVRNPWRWTFDRMNGDMYIGDVGQNAWEEVDISPAGVGDLNLGWDVMEGT
ncbi:MAG TPA: PQQ-dependent sugar dehydrogenase, partial [Polyangiaceae bacterium]|nr:PQQ-dependent sugar dehydrogenase [Polyangiaceae bacterium]